MTWRHEHKHWITRADWLSLRHRLSALMSRDSHADTHGEYHIRSLYFDNYENLVLREKMDGLLHRDKYRIRLYNLEPTTLRLERKTRHNGLGAKESARLTPEQCMRLVEGDSDFVDPSSPEVLQALQAGMRMKLLRASTVVDYVREAFVMPAGNVRITFDRDIRTGLCAKDLLDPNLPMMPVTEGDRLVLEVKYDAFLPDVIRISLQLGNRDAASVSKYALCRSWG